MNLSSCLSFFLLWNVVQTKHFLVVVENNGQEERREEGGDYSDREYGGEEIPSNVSLIF